MQNQKLRQIFTKTVFHKEKNIGTKQTEGPHQRKNKT